MGKHAYCILAHNDFYCLSKLIDLLDDERNDIFLVIDKKADFDRLSSVKTSKSRLVVAPQNKLIDIKWGTLSLVEAEILAFELAIENGHYDYIHLLSGQDLPLKSQDFIHAFCDSLPQESNLIFIDKDEYNLNDLNFKTAYFHFFIERLRCPNNFIRKFNKALWLSLIKLQKILHIKRKWTGLHLAKGTNWVSISQGFAQYLVNNRSYILHQFKRVLIPDEIYKQSLILSSSFSKSVYYIENGSCFNGRKIDWVRGFPYVWTLQELEELKCSNMLFARKFSSDIDVEIINAIYNHLKNA